MTRSLSTTTLYPSRLMACCPLELTGSALADLYQIGVRMDVYANDGRIIRSGEAWISTDYGRRSAVHPFGLQFIPPEDLDEILPVAPLPLRGHSEQHDRGG